MVRCSPSRCTVTARRSPGSRSRTASVTSPGASTRVADADDDVAGAQAGVVGGRVGHHLTDRRAAARGALRGRHAWRTMPASARRIASARATFVALTDAELPRAGRRLVQGAPRGGRALRDRPGAGDHRSGRALRRPHGVRRQEPSRPARRKPQARARRRRRRQHQPRDCLERSIGVVYRPQTRMPEPLVHRQRPLQLDALVHIDHTRAVEPLERTQARELGEPPETSPTAL
jgi:erythromycin esterase-like protein